MKTLILYFSKAVLIIKQLMASADLISTIALSLSSRLMNKISALAILDTTLDKKEKWKIYSNIHKQRKAIYPCRKIIRSAWYNLFGLKPDRSALSEMAGGHITASLS